MAITWAYDDPTYLAQTAAREAWQSGGNRGTTDPQAGFGDFSAPYTPTQQPQAGWGNEPSAPGPSPTNPYGTDDQIRGDPYGFAKQHFGTMAPTTQNLEMIYNALQARQVPVSWATNATGRSQDKFNIGNQMYDWITDVGGPNAAWSGAQAGGAPAAGGAAPGVGYPTQFSDPSTQLLEQYLTRQMAALDAQQAEQAKRNAEIQGRMPAIQASTDKLLAYLNQRAQQLQGPAYTGTEQEILRTQMLDPLERDRGASQKRALERIGARGLTPESGISQQLMNDVDAAYDKERAGAQGELAYKTVNEQRSRQQEAQSLLGLVPQIQRAGATGDLDLLTALNAAVNQPANQAIGYAAQNQRLPSMALQDALAAMGLSGGGAGPNAAFNQAMQLYGAQNQQANQGADYYNMLGMILPYLMGR